MNKTDEELKLAEEALASIAFEKPSPVTVESLADIAYKALRPIREALAETVKQRHNRCIHPGGPHPQNEFCQWRTPKTEGVPE